MTGVISEVVDGIMRTYIIGSGGEPKKSLGTGVERSGLKPPGFSIKTGSTERVAVSVRGTVISAMERVKEKLAEAGSPYELSIDPDTNQVFIKMVDKARGVVERQFPEKSLMELSKRLEDLTGSVINAKT